MEILIIFLLSIAATIIIIGLVRVLLNPYTTFTNFLMELMLIDWLSEALEAVVKLIFDIWNND